MATGYTRQSTAAIQPNLVITSASFNNEFNQLASAFDSTGGHDHSGGTGEGPMLTPGGLKGIGSVNTGVVTASGATFTLTGIGTSANQLIALDINAKLPAVDGSQLTGIGTVITDATNTVFGWMNFQ